MNGKPNRAIRSLLTLSHPVLQIAERPWGKNKKDITNIRKIQVGARILSINRAPRPLRSPASQSKSVSQLVFSRRSITCMHKSSISSPTRRTLGRPPAIPPSSGVVLHRRSHIGSLASTVCSPLPSHGLTCGSSRTCGPSRHAASPGDTLSGLFHGSTW